MQVCPNTTWPRSPRSRICLSNRKRAFRALWIQRINAGARENGLTYAQFMNGMKKAGVELDRKVLSDLAHREPEAFKSLVEQARQALAA